MQYWFNLYAPERLNEKTKNEEKLTDSGESSLNFPSNKIDSQRIFKGKTDKKKVANEPTRGKSQSTVQKSRTANFRQHKSVTRSPQR